MARKKGEGCFRQEGEFHVWILGLGPDPVTGKPRRKVIKRKDLRELKRLVRQYLRDAEDEVPSTRGNAITGDAWAERWLETVRLHRERNTHKSYADTWRIWLQPRLGRKPLEKIGTSDVQAACDDAKRAGFDATARYVLVVAKTMLNAARRHSPPFIGHDPCAGVAVPDGAGPRKRVLSHDEVDEVLAELYRYVEHTTNGGGHFAHGHRHLIRFMLETGLRESEALGLQEFQIDLRAKPPKVHVAGQLDLDGEGKPYVKPYTKGKDDRTVFLSPAAVEAVKEQRKLVAEYRDRAKEAYDERALVFPSEAGTPIGARNLIRSVESVRDGVNATREAEGEAPRPHWTAHDLRRTFGTRIAQTGAGLKVTQRLMGHKNEATTAKIYVVAEEDDLIKAVERMANRREA